VACDFLKQSLFGTTRDRITNWRGYLYTLLRGFDEEAYSAMKVEQGHDRRKTRVERRPTEKNDKGEHIVREMSETQEPQQPQQPQQQKPQPQKPQKPDRQAKEQDKPPELNEAATEFVPGKQSWAGAKEDEKKAFSHKAAEFVPGTPWTGSGSPTGAGNAKRFSHTAPEFVPGQLVWSGSPEVAAMAAAAAASPMNMLATPAFQLGTSPYPVRPWPQQQQQQYQQATPRSAGQQKRRSTGGGGGGQGNSTPGQRGARPDANNGGASGRAAAKSGGGGGGKATAANKKPDPAALATPAKVGVQAETAPPAVMPQVVEKVAVKDEAAHAQSENTDGHGSPPSSSEGGWKLAVLAVSLVGAASLFVYLKRRR